MRRIKFWVGVPIMASMALSLSAASEKSLTITGPYSYRQDFKTLNNDWEKDLNQVYRSVTYKNLKGYSGCKSGPNRGCA